MSHLNDSLEWQLKAAGLIFLREYKAIEGRRFRWDFAIPSANLLIEVLGGTYSRGKSGHTSGAGAGRDCEKLNLATLHGWRSLNVDCKMVVDGRALMFITMACCEPVKS